MLRVSQLGSERPGVSISYSGAVYGEKERTVFAAPVGGAHAVVFEAGGLDPVDERAPHS